MSDFTHSTLTSPRSPLFSDPDTPDSRQSGSEIVTSDEEPDLGAFTTVLRFWGYLQPPLRIPTHFQSSSSSRTRSTPTTITGYPGFGGDDTETIEESTVWNRGAIQSYLRQSFGTDTSSGRTELARERVLREPDDEDEFTSSPPPSPASDGARTVEIASEVDAASVHSVTYEDGASGERLVVPIVTPPSMEGRTVSVASGAESHDEQTHFPQLSILSSIGPHLQVVNDNTLSSFSSISPIPSTRPYSASNQPFDDNTTISIISRHRTSPSTISVVSYQPQMDAPRTQTSVFQESPSPNPALVESGAPFHSPSNTLDVPRPSARRVVSNSSHAESDIINSYYAHGPGVLSPSTDQPAMDFPRPRRLEILAQPPSLAPGSNQQPLQEQDSPLPDHRRPSIVDDNSSSSALVEDTTPPSATTSGAVSVLREPLTDNSESSLVHSSHSLSPTQTIILPPISASVSSTSSITTQGTGTTTATVTANHSRHPSLDSFTSTRQYPSLTSTHREPQSRNRPRLDTSIFQGMQTAPPHLHYHLLSAEGDPDHEQPSLGYLDEALRFIAAERARWTAAREAELQRGSSPQRVEEERVFGEGGVVFQQGGTWRYAIGSVQKSSPLTNSLTETSEPQPEKRKKLRYYKGHKSLTVTSATPTSSNQIEDVNTINVNERQPRHSSSTNDTSSASENVVILDSPQRKKSQNNKSTITITTNSSTKNEIVPISILKRPETSGVVNETMNGRKESSTTTTLSSTLNFNNSVGYSHSHVTAVSLHAHTSPSMPPVGVGGGSTISSATKFDNGSATPRGHGYLYPSSQAQYTQNTTVEDDEDDDEYEEGEKGGEESSEDGFSRHSHLHLKSIAERRRDEGDDDIERWYLDKYGKRIRQSDHQSQSPPTFHRRTQSTGSAQQQKSLLSISSRYVSPGTMKLGLGFDDPGRGDNCGADDDGGYKGEEPTTDQTNDSEVEEGGEDEEEEEDDKDAIEGTLGEETKKEISKRKKKKKKSKKRKLPVTVPVPLTVTSSLSHSRSVPNLRSEAGRSGGSSTDSTAEDDWRDKDGSSGGELSGPGRLGALVPSVSFPEASRSSSSSKKKGKQQSAADPFVLRGNLLNVTSPTIGERGFVAQQSKRARLVALARHLQTLFPEERETLKKVVGKLEPPLKADKKQKKKKGAKPFLDDCSLEYSSLADSDLQRAQDDEDPDPRGDPPGKKDTLVHVFIDHSNILIGFLTHLKRMSRKLKQSPLASKLHVTQYPNRAINRASTSYNNSSRPLPIPKTKAGVPIPDTKPLIPLPSFATAITSSLTPASVKNDISYDGNDSSGTDVPVFEFDGEGYGYEKVERRVAENSVLKKSATVIQRPLHLWHTALALVLERGRPITRRYVVASRPLHQPMESLEHLGYEVSILTRVPDFGDGADRLEKAAKQELHSKEKDSDSRNGSPMKGFSFPFRQIGGKNHVRGTSATTLYGETDSTASTQQTGSMRVKYREQGVDEVLQLKLLTVVAATDNVPVGSTIILATGDGNVGQFNEDGYIGPVRNALKHGWKVELYAWEDGLSRSWRREFGPSSEWGRKGMFRVIAMEQFAECLVDLG